MALFAAFVNKREEEHCANKEEQGSEVNWLSNVSYKSAPVENEKLPAAKKVKERRVKRKKPKDRSKKFKKEKPAPRLEVAVESKKQRYFLLPKDTFSSDFLKDVQRRVDNLTYDSFYSGETALYTYPKRLLHCLGCQGDEELHQLFCRMLLRKMVADKSAANRYYKKKFRRLIASSKPQRMHVNNSKEVHFENFMPVNLRTVSADGVECEYDFDLKMFKPLLEDDCHEEEAQCTSSKAEQMRLTQLLNVTPGCQDLWLELLQVEDGIYEKSLLEIAPERRVSRLSYLERRLAIVEKAIQKCPKSVALQLSRLETLREMNVPKADLQKEWMNLQFTQVNQSDVWIGRIRFNLYRFADFSVASQLSALDACLEKTFLVLTGQLITHPPQPDTSKLLLDCLLAKVLFLSEAGHCERAFRTFQALVEFLLCAPSDELSHGALSSKRAKFESRWSHCVCHIGESGWTPSTSNGPGDNLARQLTSRAQQEEDDLCQKFGAAHSAKTLWLALETSRDRFHWFPVADADEADCEDPERIVLFDDLVSSLYDLRTTVEKCWLLVEMIGALRLAKLPRFQSSNRNEWFDTVQWDDCAEHFACLPVAKSARHCMEESERVFDQVCSHCRPFLPAYPWADFLLCAQVYNRARTLQARDEISPEMRLKHFKSYCKQFMSCPDLRNSVLLYATYADGLAHLGANKEAQQTAFSILCTLRSSWLTLAYGSSEQLAYLTLASSYAQISLEMSDDPEILRVLGSFLLTGRVSAQGVGFSDAEVRQLRDVLMNTERQFCGRLLKDLENSSDWYFRVGWLGSSYALVMHVQALFFCFIGQVEHGLSIYHHAREQVRQALANGGLDARVQSRMYRALERDVERLWEWEACALRVFLFKRRDPRISPSLVLRTMREAMDEFPNHASFASLFCSLQLRNSLIVQLRRSLDITSPKCTVIRFVAAVWAEFCQYIKLRDEVESNPSMCLSRISGILSSAVERHAHCAPLWQLYMIFQRLAADANGRSDVEGVAYLALRNCPWNKDLFVEAVRCFPEDKTQMVVDLMLEKGVRLRLPWEELLLLKKSQTSLVEEEKEEISMDL